MLQICYDPLQLVAAATPDLFQKKERTQNPHPPRRAGASWLQFFDVSVCFYCYPDQQSYDQYFQYYVHLAPSFALPPKGEGLGCYLRYLLSYASMQLSISSLKSGQSSLKRFDHSSLLMQVITRSGLALQLNASRKMLSTSDFNSVRSICTPPSKWYIFNLAQVESFVSG